MRLISTNLTIRSIITGLSELAANIIDLLRYQTAATPDTRAVVSIFSDTGLSVTVFNFAADFNIIETHRSSLNEGKVSADRSKFDILISFIPVGGWAINLVRIVFW
jgi:hypothetical protein